MTTSTPTKDFVEGFAQLLAAASIGLSWDPALSYSPGQTGIFIASMPPTPNRCVVLTPYPLAASPTLSDSTEGLQIRTRSAAADVRDVWALSDAIDSYLLGLFPVTLPTGIHISSLLWTSGGSLGQEPGGDRRWEWASNYTANVWRPSLHRT